MTTAWMFGNAGDHANAMCQLYRATRPSVAQLETLLVAMAVDGTGAQACDFDPIVDAPDYATLTRDDASRLLSAGYVVRGCSARIRSKMHRLTLLSDIFDASAFEERARRGSRRRRSAV